MDFCSSNALKMVKTTGEPSAKCLGIYRLFVSIQAGARQLLPIAKCFQLLHPTPPGINPVADEMLGALEEIIEENGWKEGTG